MPSAFEIGPYYPCPCGSGNKYKFCCAARARDRRHGKFPIGTVALYGPDNKVTTKIAAGVVLDERSGPAELERWVGTAVLGDPKVTEAIRRFFARHGVKSVVVTAGNLGCPHEEGIDFPRGSDCPFCPFWAGMQGTAARRPRDEPGGAWDDDDDDDDASENPLSEGSDSDDPGDDDRRDDTDGDEIERMNAIVGDSVADFGKAVAILFHHLVDNLQLPCEVTGSEDFQWEEPYVLGAWDPRKYKQLKVTQPSYRDRYELIGLDNETVSEWMMFDEDIAAHVRRVSDGKRFVLGLAELEATDRKSPNYQLLQDYAVWFVNSR